MKIGVLQVYGHELIAVGKVRNTFAVVIIWNGTTFRYWLNPLKSEIGSNLLVFFVSRKYVK